MQIFNQTCLQECSYMHWCNCVVACMFDIVHAFSMVWLALLCLRHA
jgi:hypothetical protein